MCSEIRVSKSGTGEEPVELCKTEGKDGVHLQHVNLRNARTQSTADGQPVQANQRTGTLLPASVCQQVLGNNSCPITAQSPTVHRRNDPCFSTLQRDKKQRALLVKAADIAYW